MLTEINDCTFLLILRAKEDGGEVVLDHLL